MNIQKYNRIAVLDTETTDRYWNTCAPVQIAAVICDNKGNIIDSFNERIKTTHTISPDASAVHGIYAKDLENCRGEIAVLTDFCVWMKQQEVDCVLTYNGEAFDRRMLNARCEKLGIHYEEVLKLYLTDLNGKLDILKPFYDKLSLFDGLITSKGLAYKHLEWKITHVSIYAQTR